MYISSLKLENFRSHRSFSSDLSPQANLILGNNGQGKTNILEAISVLAAGKSLLHHTLSELVSWGSNYSIVQAILETANSKKQLELQLVTKPQGGPAGRRLLVDTVETTRSKFLGTLKVVLFDPDDLRLISGSPSRRRDYLDQVLSSLFWPYASALRVYHRALRHRNELLDLIFQQKAKDSELFYWDQSLVKNSDIVQSYRKKFIDFSNHFWQQNTSPEVQKLHLNYHSSQLSAQILRDNYFLDLRRGSTQKGPHRDDFSLESSLFDTPDKSLLHWGSRGQQRLAVLALKLAEIGFIEAEFLEYPILLLDDIFSELDDTHRQLVIDLCSRYQSITTSAEPDVSKLLPSANIIHL